MWCGAQQLGSETSQYLNSAVLQWLWPAGRRQVFLGSQGKAAGKARCVSSAAGQAGSVLPRTERCNASLPPPHRTDSQPEPGTRGERTEHREKRHTEITNSWHTDMDSKTKALESSPPWGTRHQPPPWALEQGRGGGWRWQEAGEPVQAGIRVP